MVTIDVAMITLTFAIFILTLLMVVIMFVNAKK